MQTPHAPNSYAHGTLDTVHQHHDGNTMAGQTHRNNRWNAHQGYGMNNQGRNLMSDFDSPSQRTSPSTPNRGGTRRQRGVIRRGKKTKRSNRSHKKTRRARKKSKSHRKRH